MSKVQGPESEVDDRTQRGRLRPMSGSNRAMRLLTVGAFCRVELERSAVVMCHNIVEIRYKSAVLRSSVISPVFVDMVNTAAVRHSLLSIYVGLRSFCG